MNAFNLFVPFVALRPMVSTMMRRHLWLLLIVSSLISGCSAIRPADAMVTISGHAPADGGCEIQLLQVSKADFHNIRRAVNGPFEETFFLPFRNQEYFLEGACAGEVTFMKEVVFPKDAPLDIGYLAH